jgi:hypothetical protein
MKQWPFLANREQAELTSLVHSLWASFKQAYSALLAFERAPLLLHSGALIKPVYILAQRHLPTWIGIT